MKTKTTWSSEDASAPALWASAMRELISRAIEGGALLKPARELADNYRNDNRYASDHERVDALIRWQASKNGLSSNRSG